jgi:hypothetical protein
MRPNRHTIAAACVFALAWTLPSMAEAFYILSPKSEACHERLMLGSLQAAPAPFGDSPTSTEILLEHFAARAGTDGVPSDDATSAFIDEISERFGLQEHTLAEQFVLASFVAGVRQPDTDGMSVVKFNETRHIHLHDENQPLHALRQRDHNDEAGNAQAISASRQIVVDRVESAVASWRTPAYTYAVERWSFSFYGEVDVRVFGPAFQLGRASHVIQDAFAHAFRDDQMRITSVANFVDALQGRYFEQRDGPSHSDRLDECDVEQSAFDEMRVIEARDATAELLEATTVIFGDGDSSLSLKAEIEKRADPALDRVFALTTGCTYENDYCDSEWTSISNSDLTEPYDLSFCSADSPTKRPGASTALVAAALASVFLLWRFLRSRSRRATS